MALNSPIKQIIFFSPLLLLLRSLLDSLLFSRQREAKRKKERKKQYYIRSEEHIDEGDVRRIHGLQRHSCRRAFKVCVVDKFSDSLENFFDDNSLIYDCFKHDSLIFFFFCVGLGIELKSLLVYFFKCNFSSLIV